MQNTNEEREEVTARLDDIERTCITWIDRSTQLELTITKLSWQLAEVEKRVNTLTTMQQAMIAKLDRVSIAAGIA